LRDGTHEDKIIRESGGAGWPPRSTGKDDDVTADELKGSARLVRSLDRGGDAAVTREDAPPDVPVPQQEARP
jgi:hypothetical protein